MSYIFLDIIFSLILIVGFIIGIKKGAIKIFLSLLSTVCAAFLTYCFSNTITSYIYNKLVKPSIVNKVYSSFENNNASDDILPNFITKQAENFGIELKQLKFSNSITKDSISNLVENTLHKSIFAIVNIIVSIVLFLLLLVFLKLILNTFNKLVKHSYINGINNVLGGVIGTINGLVIIVIICFMLTLCYKNSITLPSFISEESVNKSLFFRLFSYIF